MIYNIALDAMGGDNGPVEMIKGAIESLEQIKNIKILLVGKEDVINAELKKYTYDKNLIEVVNATEVIATEEGAMAIKKKKDSSIVVGLNLLKDGNAGCFVSAGSTGALLTGATLKLKRLPGVSRPALATLLPTGNSKGFSLLMDCGANADCKPNYLVEFAHLGSVYVEHMLGIKNPKVGLVNIGAEDDKGNALTKETFPLLKETNLNFVGNIESRYIPSGEVDVAVCDGFTGNIVLKTTEGYAKFIFDTLKKELTSSLLSKLGAVLSTSAFKNIKKTFDYSEVGGAPFLGLTSLVVKTHGSANSKDVVGAIRQSFNFLDKDILKKMEESNNGIRQS